VTLRYRVYEPETPHDLPRELVPEWLSEIVIEPDMSLEIHDGEVWQVAAVGPGPDEGFARRVFLARSPHIDYWNCWYSWYGNAPAGFAKLSATFEGTFRRGACVLVTVGRGGTSGRL